MIVLVYKITVLILKVRAKFVALKRVTETIAEYYVPPCGWIHNQLIIITAFLSEFLKAR